MYSRAITPSGQRKGNLLIGQSGGATAVINASLVGAVIEAERQQQINDIYGALHGIEGVLKRQIVDLRRESAEIWDDLLLTPSAALGSCRYKLQPDDLPRALETLRSLDVRYFLYIGGNDSADTAHHLALAAQEASYDLSVICIPKTIDNDLPLTDHCPGYGSAARFIALATMDSAMNTMSIPHHFPVKIIEVMGRDAGWLAAASALGKERPEDAPHLIYFPERRFNRERFLNEICEVYDAVGYVVVVVAETIRDEQGQPLGASGAQGADAFAHPLLSGTAQQLFELVNTKLGLRARFDKPGDLQRMASFAVSITDRDEAYFAGQMAVRYAVRGASDKMVTLVRRPGKEYSCATSQADLSAIANSQRLLPDAFINEAGTGVTPAFYDYALPLIGEPLPRHVRLKKVRV